MDSCDYILAEHYLYCFLIPYTDSVKEYIAQKSIEHRGRDSFELSCESLLSSKEVEFPGRSLLDFENFEKSWMLNPAYNKGEYEIGTSVPFASYRIIDFEEYKSVYMDDWDIFLSGEQELISELKCNQIKDHFSDKALYLIWSRLCKKNVDIDLKQFQLESDLLSLIQRFIVDKSALQIEPKEILERLQKDFEQSLNWNNWSKIGRHVKSVYYPGAGKDFSTLSYLHKKYQIREFMFSDYNESPNERPFENEKNEEIDGLLFNVIGEQFPDDYSCVSWIDFWDKRSPKISSFNEKNCSIKKVSLNIEDSDVNLKYFYTEAVGTFRVLNNSGIFPDLVVLQDHGFGGNWAQFGGNSPLYQVALASGQLPKYLFVGDNTEPWDGYTLYDVFHGEFGSAKHKRALYIHNKQG